MAEEETKQVSEDFEDDDDLGFDDLDDEEEGEKPSTKEGEEEGQKNRDDDDEKKSKSKEEQDKEERSRQAKARREREAKEREQREKEIEKKAYLKGKLDSTKVNTFTEEPIEDEYDLFIYETQKELEKEGKDPIADLPKRLAQINRKSAEEAKKKESEQKQLEEKIDKEFADFKSKYPEIKIKELLEDPDFKDYADGRLGKGEKSLTQLYESFSKFKEKFTKKEEEEKDEDDGKTPPPSPTGGRKTSKKSYSDMSEEERIKFLRRQGLIN